MLVHSHNRSIQKQAQKATSLNRMSGFCISTNACLLFACDRIGVLRKHHLTHCIRETRKATKGSLATINCLEVWPSNVPWSWRKDKLFGGRRAAASFKQVLFGWRTALNHSLSRGRSGTQRVNVDTINITVENTGEQLNPAAQKQLAGQVQGIVLSTLANEAPQRRNALMAYIQFNDIPLDPSLTQERSQRVQRAQFGDGYSQVLTDGLNAEQETWQCQTPPLTYPEINSIESFFLEQKGQAISWIPPFSTKTFFQTVCQWQVESWVYKLSALTLTGYTTPSNYSVNLVTGVLTSVDIADGTDIPISLTLAAKNFLLSDGWRISTLSFSLCSIVV